MLPRLQVSENRRFLMKEDGAPFFYLGDTAWELFHRLNREDANEYLAERARQGFTVIQAVALAEHEYDRPNPYGHLPLEGNDPTRPVEAYFQHVDYIVDRAASLGIYTGMLPTWGDKWNRKWGKGPEFFTPQNAAIYGEWMGRRYRDRPIIWILGGDRPIENETHRQIIQAMAEGIRAGDGGRGLMSFHPMGGHSSSEYFQNEPWLDLNMMQTGHSRNRDCYRSVAEDYARMPVKPCMDAEPGYEDHPNGFKVENGYLDEIDVRKSAYWDLFAGAFGHTYGCHDIWQFLTTAFPPVTAARTPWQKALVLPGARQMQYARHLLESRPFFNRIPDQDLIAEGQADPPDHIQATRDSDGSYAFIYFPTGKPAKINLSRLSGGAQDAWWYDPRTGASHRAGNFLTASLQEFVPPSSGNGHDWVLVLDDPARHYPPPGRVATT